MPTAATALGAASAGRWCIEGGQLTLDATACRLLGEGERRQALDGWLGRLDAATADAVRAALAGGQPLAVMVPRGTATVLLQGSVHDGAAHGLAIELPAAPPSPSLAARDEFFAGISHELRTPLNAILGFNRLARAELPPGPGHRHLEHIEASSRLMLRVVNDLLDLARLEAGKLEIRPDQPLCPAALVARVGHVGASLRQDKPIQLYALVDPACPAALRGDAGRIEQVLLNLLGNALKFTLRGMVVLAVKPRLQRGRDVTLRWSVSDTGVGIEYEALQRLGRPFERAGAATPLQPPGTGLGLAVVRRLLELHGTQLNVASVAGGGTTCWFDLTLPLDDTVPAEDLQPDSAVFTEDRRFAASVATQWRAHGRRLAGADEAPRRWIVDSAAPGAAAHAAAARARGLEVVHASAAPADGALPLALLADALLRPAVAEAAEPGGELAGLSVLVLEDNPLNQQVLAALLQRAGARAVLTADGESALARAGREHFDVALFDIQLPGDSGLETARRLRATRAGERLPIVFLSAHLGDDEQQEAAALGALAALTKPCEPAELLAVLRRVPRAAGAPPAAATPPHPVPPSRLRRIFADTWPAQRRLLTDGDTLRRGVHSLRGSLALLGEHEALAMARAVEEGLLAGQPAHTLPVAALLARADAIAAG